MFGLIAYSQSKVPGAISLIIFSAFLGNLVMLISRIAFLFKSCPRSDWHGGDLSERRHCSLRTIHFRTLIYKSVRLDIPPGDRFAGNFPTADAGFLLGRTVASIFFTNSYEYANHFDFTGSWDKIWSVYLDQLVGVAALLLIDDFIRRPRPLARYWVILVGCFAPFLVLLTRITDLTIPFPFDPSLAAFTLAGLGFSYGLANRDLITSVPLTPEVVVKHMNDGWIVLDTENIIVDINPAAERIIGLSRAKAYGQPISTVLTDVRGFGKSFDDFQELEMKRSIRSQENWRYFNIRNSLLKDHHNLPFGRLILWRDITERKLAEDAHQRARDEMFVLLNAISSAASQASDLDEFLSESIYQIIIPFRSQAVAIFLMMRGRRELQIRDCFWHPILESPRKWSMRYRISTASLPSPI